MLKTQAWPASKCIASLTQINPQNKTDPEKTDACLGFEWGRQQWNSLESCSSGDFTINISLETQLGGELGCNAPSEVASVTLYQAKLYC